MAFRNLWSLNIDEALVIEKIKNSFNADYEVFIPASRQLSNIDLVHFHLGKRKANTIQVKGSRTYEPRPSEVNRYGNGSAAWITIAKKSIFQPKNRVDYYIFVLHSFVSGATRKDIKIDFLVVPITQFQKLAKRKKVRAGGKYHFFIWIDSKAKRSFEFNNPGGQTFDLSRYLNNWALMLN